MIVTGVSYKDFRNIAEARVGFSPGVNVFLGNNAQGKTNALEGIYLMAAGKSFRTSKEREMVRFGSPFFDVTLLMKDERREQSLSFRAYSAESGKRRECRKNGVLISRVGELLGTFRAVLFCPEHLSIVKDGPSERRNFLDVAISQLRPLYLTSLTRYTKILAQRNALLKQLSDGVGDRCLLGVYSEQMAREAAFIYTARREYIGLLDGYVKSFFDELGGMSGKREVPAMVYKNSLKTDGLSESEAFEGYRNALNANVSREIAAGASLYGSHKDDIEIWLDGREARLYASQGQQRSIALAMKLGEGEISREYSGEYPVFLFDDVLSELDASRQEFLISRLGERQVIMTACTPPATLAGANFIRVGDGRYESYDPGSGGPAGRGDNYRDDGVGSEDPEG